MTHLKGTKNRLVNSQRDLSVIEIARDLGFSKPGMRSCACFQAPIIWKKMGAISHLTNILITWSDQERSYYASLKGVTKWDSMPSEVFSGFDKISQCSCGSPLRFGDFTYKQKGKKFTFKGEYYCPICNSTLFPWSKRRRRKWGRVKSFSISTSGLQVERDLTSSQRRKTTLR